MSGKVVIRGGQKILGALDSGLGDPILTRDDTSKNVGAVPPIDSSTFIPTTLTSGRILIGNSLNVAQERQVTGAISISNTGVTTIASDIITNANINSAAGISYSKLNLSTSIVNNDIAVAANITRTKIANGSANRILINNASGVFSDASAITASRVLISDVNGIPTHSGVTDVTLGYLDATSSIQTQLNNRLSFSSAITPVQGDIIYYNSGAWVRLAIGSAGQVLTVSGSSPVWGAPVSNGLPTGGTANQYLRKVNGTDYNTTWDTLTVSKITDLTATAAELNILDGATLTVTELNYVDGVTSGIQGQLNNKLNSALAQNAMFVGNVAGQATQLSTGANGYVLTSVAGVPQWQAIPISSLPITTLSTNTTLDATHYTVLGDATGGAVTITLPAASTCTGRIYVIKKIDASGNFVIADGNGSETIDGATTLPLNNQWDSTMIQSNGTAWFVLADNL